MKIPKIIHSVWIGQNEKPKLVLKCEKSWKKFCVDYKFIEWNENTFSIKEAPLFVQQAYFKKKWAFVSDYIRLWALYHYGGIYLDSDMELLKNIDCFLDNKSFTGFEDNISVQTSIIGSEKKNDFILKLKNYYKTRPFILDSGILDTTTNVEIISNFLSENGLIRNNKTQLIDNNLKIYPSEYFCPKNFATGKITTTENTYAIHHFNMSWLSPFIKLKIKAGRIAKRLFKN